MFLWLTESGRLHVSTMLDIPLPLDGVVALDEEESALLRRKRLPMSPYTDTLNSLAADPPAEGVLLCLKMMMSESVKQYEVWYVQGSAKRLQLGLVSFVSVVAYYFCLSLPAAFMRPDQSPFSRPLYKELG